MELLKYNVQKCFENIKEKLTKIINGNNFNAIEQIIEEMRTFQSKYTSDNLYNHIENEIKYLNVIIDIKNAQLKEQLILIKVLVQRLFNLDVGLRFLEARAQSVVRFNNIKIL